MGNGQKFAKFGFNGNVCAGGSSMQADEFQPGIYRHYNNGKLYFASEIRENNTSGELCVCYDALYSGTKRGYWKPFSEFGEIKLRENQKPVPRFTLVKALPVEKMQMLLPGKKFNYCHNRRWRICEITEVFWDESLKIALKDPRGEKLVLPLSSWEFFLRAPCQQAYPATD